MKAARQAAAIKLPGTQATHSWAQEHTDWSTGHTHMPRKSAYRQACKHEGKDLDLKAMFTQSHTKMTFCQEVM